MLPERGIGNVGGAMDLAAGARRTIVAMEHTDRSSTPKILRECSYPLTGKRCVSLIVTDIAVVEVTPEGLLLAEVAPDWTAEEVQGQTGARLATFIADSKSAKEFVLDLTSGELVEIT